ncbi:MAG: gamma carbonic anhydrase family protein [Chloroflexi bacterium]|nr:gamma carbonic anhydrase family protein [Chloroflexota bacterium]MBM3174576.1 gamma carbonic anhydrase family protein [Chloroflexota bacterium]MBM4451174.1 gamma carbonic anhydrase family protein [Chloroflexota bacterium]
MPKAWRMARSWLLRVLSVLNVQNNLHSHTIIHTITHTIIPIPTGGATRRSMILKFNGKSPQIAESAYISPAATIIGDVEIGEKANIWPGAVVRGDLAKITIGSYASIEDNCVIHSPLDISIGDNVIVGHGAVIHCRKIGDNVLIGNNATILDDVEIGDFCVIGSGALVAPGTKVPERSMAMGVPARVKGQVSEEHVTYIVEAAKFNYNLALKYKQQGL